MAAKTQKKGFFSNWIVRNLLAAVIVVVVLVLGAMAALNLATQHNKEITVPDLHGVEVAEAQKLLKQFGLQGHTVGEGTCVTGQIPEAGSVVPGNCEILLYLENQPEIRQVTVPDFTGMTRQQANDAAGLLGLYILVSGNTDLDAVVTAQNYDKDTQVPVGTTIKLEFADTKAAD